MAPDLIPIDPSSDDDARLLAAIERAWPVPPMPSRVKETVMAAATPISPGNLIAPIAIAPARRSWGMLARIAAVIALVLAGMAAITHETGPERGVPVFLQAPTLETSGCTLKQRSRDEVRQLVAEARDGFTPPANSPQSLVIQVSTWDLSTGISSDEQQAILQLADEMNLCLRAGVPLAALAIVNPELIKQFARYEYPGSPDDAVTDELMRPMGSQTGFRRGDRYFPLFDRFYKGQDGFIFGTNQTAEDPLGNAAGWIFAKVDGTWMFVGVSLLIGPWSSLASGAAQPLTTPQCPSNLLRTEEQAMTLANQKPTSSTNDERTLVVTIGASEIERQTVDAADDLAIRNVVAAYAACVRAGNQPILFTATTDAFFWNLVTPNPYELDPTQLLNTDEIQYIAPNEVSQVTPLADGRMLAIISTTMGNASQSTTLAGIILIKQDGEWKIDQLALVENQP